MRKVLKISAVILIFLNLIYFGGSFLLPEKQYFTDITQLQADRVAAFSKLIAAEYLKDFSVELPDKKIEIFLSDTILYNEIHYLIQFEDGKMPMKAGYYLRENNIGTELLWYLEIDSLHHPYQRWEGFLAPILYRNKIRQGFVLLEEDIRM